MAAQGKLLTGERADVFLANGKTPYVLVQTDTGKLRRPGSVLDLTDKWKIWAIQSHLNSFSPLRFLSSSLTHLDFKHIKLTQKCLQQRYMLFKSLLCPSFLSFEIKVSRVL